MFLVNLFKGSIYHNDRQHKVYLYQITEDKALH